MPWIILIIAAFLVIGAIIWRIDTAGSAQIKSSQQSFSMNSPSEYQARIAAEQARRAEEQARLEAAAATAAAKINWQEMNRRIIGIMQKFDKVEAFSIQHDCFKFIVRKGGWRADLRYHPTKKWIQLEFGLHADMNDSMRRLFHDSFDASSYGKRTYADIITNPPEHGYKGDLETIKWFNAHGTVQIELRQEDYYAYVNLVFVLIENNSITLKEFVKHLDFTNPYIHRVYFDVR